MGLDIYSKSSNKSYHFGYSGIHQLRYIAYRVVGGDKTFSGYMRMGDERPEGCFDFCYTCACYHFPNLMFHSDCEGTYTKRGKVLTDEHLLKGNSKGLLKELEALNTLADRENAKGEIRWDDIFPQLYELVKDVVENGDGKLIFN